MCASCQMMQNDCWMQVMIKNVQIACLIPRPIRKKKFHKWKISSFSCAPAAKWCQMTVGSTFWLKMSKMPIKFHAQFEKKIHKWKISNFPFAPAAKWCQMTVGSRLWLKMSKLPILFHAPLEIKISQVKNFKFFICASCQMMPNDCW